MWPGSIPRKERVLCPRPERGAQGGRPVRTGHLRDLHVLGSRAAHGQEGSLRPALRMRALPAQAAQTGTPQGL